MRRKIVAGNWKMNNDLQQAMKLLSEIRDMVEDEVSNKADIIITPSFPFIHTIAQMLKNSRIKTAAQDCSAHESGAYTGEVSAQMIKSSGAGYVIIGHSERRKYFNENNELLLGKVKQALKNDLQPIFCCGEVLDERKENKHFNVVQAQMENVVMQLTTKEFEKIIIAYEPVWAIGTGETATPEQAQEMHAHIRSFIKGKFGEEIADNTSILYGGSCNASNAAGLFANADIDGGLIGGASLKSRDFTEIIKAIQN
ncbi:MAG: triose-phosphate isomerase [Bacteroidia bacterium]